MTERPPLAPTSVGSSTAAPAGDAPTSSNGPSGSASAPAPAAETGASTGSGTATTTTGWWYLRDHSDGSVTATLLPSHQVPQGHSDSNGRGGESPNNNTHTTGGSTDGPTSGRNQESFFSFGSMDMHDPDSDQALFDQLLNGPTPRHVSKAEVWEGEDPPSGMTTFRSAGHAGIGTPLRSGGTPLLGRSPIPPASGDGLAGPCDGTSHQPLASSGGGVEGGVVPRLRLSKLARCRTAEVQSLPQLMGDTTRSFSSTPTPNPTPHQQSGEGGEDDAQLAFSVQNSMEEDHGGSVGRIHTGTSGSETEEGLSAPPAGVTTSSPSTSLNVPQERTTSYSESTDSAPGAGAEVGQQQLPSPAGSTRTSSSTSNASVRISVRLVDAPKSGETAVVAIANEPSPPAHPTPAAPPLHSSSTPQEEQEGNDTTGTGTDDGYRFAAPPMHAYGWGPQEAPPIGVKKEDTTTGTGVAARQQQQGGDSTAPAGGGIQLKERTTIPHAGVEAREEEARGDRGNHNHSAPPATPGGSSTATATGISNSSDTTNSTSGTGSAGATSTNSARTVVESRIEIPNYLRVFAFECLSPRSITDLYRLPDAARYEALDRLYRFHRAGLRQFQQ